MQNLGRTPVVRAGQTSNDIIPEYEKIIKRKNSDCDSAISHFGTTYSWKETGYLLTNGKKLDFSGRNEGASGGYRTVDHRDIVDIYPEDSDLSGTEAMVDFMSQGNIRIMPEMVVLFVVLFIGFS